MQGNFSTEGAVLKCISINFFSLKICISFRTTAKKRALENYVLAYLTADKDHGKILKTVFPSFLVCFLCPI